ncbi:MAG: hypothetical protein WCJ04_10875 [Actinomycetes bacterium]
MIQEREFGGERPLSFGSVGLKYSDALEMRPADSKTAVVASAMVAAPSTIRA